MEVVDDPIVISFSEISDYRQCPFKHHLGYQRRWQTEKTPIHLTRGTNWHLVLEHRYDPTKSPDDPAVRELLRYDPEATQENALLQWMYEGYCEMWDKEDKTWTFEAVEQKILHPLPNPTGGPSRFVLKAKIDAIAVRRGRRWVWDHKTGKNMPGNKDFDFDDQFGLYMWVLRASGMKVAGSLHNFARTQRNKKPMELTERFSRTEMVRTDTELNRIAIEAYRTAEKMWPLDMDPSIPERHPDTERCGWRCGFTEACLSDRKGGRLDDMLRAHGFEQRMFRPVELALDEIRRKNT